MKRKSTSRASTMLGYVEPCLAQARETPPSGPEWVHEIKYDGYRVQGHVRGGKATLLTRKGLDWTAKLGRVAGELAELDIASAIVDGEAIVQNVAGVADFQALQRELSKGPAARIVMMAFDLLHLDGQDLRPRPLIERKAELRRILARRPEGALLQLSDHIEGDGSAILEQVRGLGLEGIVSKRVDRPYRSGRTGDWTKVKCVMADPFVVIGYARSNVAAELIGSLVLGYYRDGKLVYAGRVGTGFTVREAAAMWQAMQGLRIRAPALARKLTREQLDGVVWIEPRLVAQVEYRAWSSDNIVRHAAFKAFRTDKSPDEIGQPETLARTRQ